MCLEQILQPAGHLLGQIQQAAVEPAIEEEELGAVVAAHLLLVKAAERAPAPSAAPLLLCRSGGCGDHY